MTWQTFEALSCTGEDSWMLPEPAGRAPGAAAAAFLAILARRRRRP